MWGFFIFIKFRIFVFMGEIVDYSKLRLDVLEKIIYQRGIDCKLKKDEMIRMLKLYDEGKYVEPMLETTYDKYESGFTIGIDLKNHIQLVQMGKLVEKKEAKRLNRYASGRVYYWGPNKLI